MVRSTWSVSCKVAALCAALLSPIAAAQTVSKNIYYTRYALDNPADFQETNVRRFALTYDRAAGTISYGPRVGVTRVLGADGIVFAPDATPGDGIFDLFVGGQTFGWVHKIAINESANTATFVTQPSGVPGAFHLSMDPGGQKLWVNGTPGPLGEMPLNPFGPGIGHTLSGDDTTITSFVFVPLPAGGHDVYYTASPSNGPGNFGRIDMNTFVTTRLITGLPAAHGLVYDPWSRTLILSGGRRHAQIDPFQNPPVIVSEIDWSAQVPTLNLDQSGIDGEGLMLGASNDGTLVFVDYRATNRIGDPANFRYVEFLDTFLDDVITQFAPPPPPQDPCCPIGSGPFDRRSAQLSQLPGVSPIPFDYRAADDFYLPPGRMYKINRISGKLITDSTLPKARLELYDDCNGLPADNPRLVIPQATRITDTGQTFEGKKILHVEFDLTDFWLKGGESSWVSLIGQGTGDANEQWFWGTAGTPQGGGSPVIQGRPGAFKSAINGIPNWVSLAGPGACAGCIGCTDFNFCVDAESCKILLDNGTFADTGTPSLDAVSAGQNVTFARTADNFVIPPCASGRLCYIEAYIASNCPQARLAIYETLCGVKPAGFTPIRTLTPSRVIDTGRTVTIDNQVLPVLCLQFCGNIDLNLQPGRTYALSAFGLSTGSIAQRAYFLHNRDCARACLVNFYQGFIYGPTVGLDEWTKVSTILGTPKDYSFLVAVDDRVPDTNGQPGPGTTPDCAADINRDNAITVADIFDYLNLYFAGCP